jgi:HAMP domain-containing protein
MSLPPFRASIRRKVVLMQMVTVSTALLLAAVAFLVLEVATCHRTERRELVTLGQLVASNAAPMVAFEDPEGAGRILDGLAVRPSLTQARIYRASGGLMAGYPATAPQGEPLRVGSVQEGLTSAQNRLRLTQVIRDREGAAIGVLFLEEDLRDLHQRILTSALGLGGVLVLLGLASLLVSFRVQGLLTRPILDLSAVAGEVSRTQDYRLRARPWAQDELGHLAETFNALLDKLQTQGEQLAEPRERLEPGGEVQVESPVDPGTRFVFEAPLPPGEDLPPEEALSGLAKGPAEMGEPSPERLQSALREAPPQWLAVFEAALHQGEIDRARDLLADLPEALALGLASYLDAFRLDDLERLLLKAKETP